ncbi:MAG: phage tail protein, partial [Bacillota bacterium]
SGTDTRYSTRVFWTQLSSIIYDDFLRPGKALVGIRALATNQLSGGMPSITWIQNRDNVWVWNADSGQYEEKPATNPAWAAYDMIHRCRQIKNIHTGNFEFVVRGAPASRTIYQDFAHWAAFCDSRNLTFDYIYDTATDLWTALQKPEGVGRGKVIMRGTRFGCVCDAPGQPVQLFTVGNMITDQFSETFVGLKDRANAIEITFLNKDKGYQKDVITAYADDYDFVTEPNITQITLDGATTVAQAYREGKYRLRLNQYLRRTVNHSADIDAIACQINDVVLLAHDVPQWGFSGRLLDATATTLQFDRQVTLKPNTAYAVALQITDPAAETPQAAQSIVTLSVQGVEQEICTDTVTIAGSLSTVPQKWDLYSFGETNKVVKPFRVLDISRDQDLRRKITCLEYIEEIYHEATDVPEINYSALDTTPAEVAGVSAAEETYRQKDGTIVSNLNVAWMMARNDKMIIGYEVSYSVDDGDTWTIWATGISALNASIIGVKTNTTYLVKVSTINEAGVVSPGSISAPLLITGKDAPPSDVAEITATIDPANCTKIRLSWSGVNDIDLSGYCLWESGGIITATPITDTQYVYTATTSRQHSFSVVAVDNSGNISPIPATISLTVTVEPAQVTGFTATTQATDRSKLALSWQANTETDISYYEIRQGDRWDTGTVIATQLKATNYTVQLTTEGNQIYWIKAFNAAGNSSTLAVSQAVQVVLKPDTPANLAVAQDPKDRSIAVISWTASPGQDISGYELRCGDSWSTGMEIATVKDTLYKYTLPASGTYNFMVRAKTVAGYLSNVANHPAFSPSIEPDIVTGFTATQSISDRTQVTLSWATPSELDVAYFVIKQGPSWDEGTIIGQRVTGTYYNVRVTTEEEQTFWITAVSVAGVYSQSPVKISGIFSLNPDPVTNIQIAQQTGDKSVVDITWTGITESDLTGYQVKVGLAWDTGEALLLTKELKTTYTPGTSGTLKAMVKAVNAAGFYSDEAYATAPITLEPLDVTGLVAYQNGETIELYWDQAVEPDVVAYEIREGASSEQGQLMATGVTENKYVVNVDTEKNYRYFVKAINRSGHYSVYAAAASVNVANLPAKNVIESFDEILLRTGTATNCEFGSSLINFSNLGGRFPDYPTTRFSDVGGAQVLKLKATNGVYPDSGTYACARKDMGQIITANITVQFVSTVVLKGAGSAVLQIRTSQDGTNFTDWTTFKPAQYTFRYADFQVLLGTADTTKTPEVNQLLIKIDVPDIDIAKTATIAVGGTAVDYGHAFYTTPTVTPTALGEDLHAQVISKTASSCIIKIKNASNTDVGGQADVLIRGY